MQNTRPGEFIALVAALTALVAMTIDTMLPAIGLMARELGAAHDNDRQLIILMFFAGLGVGTLIFGPISDSVGRKPAIYAGLAFYVAGSLLCLFATSFPMLIAGRLVQGFGAASPRVVALAMVRDGAKGADMARIMSYVMSVFMLVPILAPSVGQIVLMVANWRVIFLGFMALAILAGLWLALRQEETLAPAARQPFAAAALWASAKEVVRHPVALGYTLAVGFIFAAFNVYLATSQQIFAEQYEQGAYFALWFGGLAIGIALSMIVNGRHVRQVGMRRLSRWALYVFVINWAVVLLACVISAGHPPLPVIGVLFFISFFCSGMIFGNYNAMALEPMGHIAGMAAAISGALSSLIAIALGGFAARQYDGTVYPIAVSFLIFGLLAVAASEWAEARRPALKSGI
jgi:DHA1 family bicyclomycin/chloramphenicol resistance-like MFS transporter